MRWEPSERVKPSTRLILDGVSLVAIQALIDDVNRLKAENGRLRTETVRLGEETSSLRANVEAIK
ncbi:hypothetical protein [Spirosoma koreense]